MNLKEENLGGLNCQIVDLLEENQKPEMIVIFCHGYGAPGTDLVGLGPEILNLKPHLADKVQFFFPAAPLSMDSMGIYGGRAWWHLDMEKFMASIEGGLSRDLRSEKPEGLDEAPSDACQYDRRNQKPIPAPHVPVLSWEDSLKVPCSQQTSP